MSKEPIDQMFSDLDLDRILAGASVPDVPLGAQERLLARVSAIPAADNVVAFPARKSVRQNYWLAGLPLAASLAIGVYLGAFALDDNFLPVVGGDTLVGSISDEVSTGLDEAENFAEEDLT